MSWLVRGWVGENTKDAVGGVPAETAMLWEIWANWPLLLVTRRVTT